MKKDNKINLYNIYCNVLKKYSKNENIFNYAMQHISLYKPQDIKYIIQDLNLYLENVIGISFEHLVYPYALITDKPDRFYKYVDKDNRESVSELGYTWDRKNVSKSIYDGIELEFNMEIETIDLSNIYNDNILDLFEDNFNSFIKFIKPYMLYYSYIDYRSSKLINLKAFKNYNNSFTSILFTKNNGDKIEFDVDISDIDYLINTLNKIKEMINEDE